MDGWRLLRQFWIIRDSISMAVVARPHSLELFLSSIGEGFVGRKRGEVIRTGWLYRVGSRE